MDEHRVGRRAFLVGGGAVLLGSCSSDATPNTTAAPSTTAGAVGSDVAASSTVATATAEASGPASLVAADFDSLSICRVPPMTTTGPFPTREHLDRRDVTENYPGHPLRLGIRVVDSDCRPVSGAEVEIWHADATGDYSSYVDGGSGKDEGEGTTFLRGAQTTNDDGILEFQTIYPGWYEGRAVHIHVRARLLGATVLTSQLYFDEDYTLGVYATGPYAEFGPPDTTWDSDLLAEDPASDGSVITLAAAETSNGRGTLGLVNLGVGL